MNAVEIAMYSTLSAATALTALLAGTTAVYNQQAPQGAALPYVVFGLNAGGDDNDNPHRAKALVYSVKAVGTAGFANAGSIDIQIDALLHHGTLSPSGWTNFWTARESDFRYVETPTDGGGRRFYHAGGLYRVRIAQ